ncbi:hypothetical protein STEG23_024453, partial [Scotinomys teguina]
GSDLFPVTPDSAPSCPSPAFLIIHQSVVFGDPNIYNPGNSPQFTRSTRTASTHTMVQKNGKINLYSKQVNNLNFQSQMYHSDETYHFFMPKQEINTEMIQSSFLILQTFPKHAKLLYEIEPSKETVFLNVPVCLSTLMFPCSGFFSFVSWTRLCLVDEYHGIKVQSGKDN